MEVQRSINDSESVTLVVEELNREISCRYSCNKANLMNHSYFSARTKYDEIKRGDWHVTIDSDTIFNSIVSESLLPCRRDINRATRINIVGTVTQIILQCMENDSMERESLRREDSLTQYLQILCTKPNILIAHHISLSVDYDYMVNLLERYIATIVPALPPAELWSVFEYLLFVYTDDSMRSDSFSPAAIQSPAISRMLDLARFLHWTDETVEDVASTLVSVSQPFTKEDYAERIKQYIAVMKEYIFFHMNKCVIGMETDACEEQEECGFMSMDIDESQEVRIHQASRGFVGRKYIREGGNMSLEGVVRVPTEENYKQIFTLETRGVAITAKLILKDSQTKICFDYCKKNPSPADITTEVHTTNATETFSKIEFEANIIDRIAASESYNVGHETKDYITEEKLLWINERSRARERLFSGLVGSPKRRTNEYVVFRINVCIRVPEMPFV